MTGPPGDVEDEAAVAPEPRNPAALRPASDPPGPVVETGEAGCLPFQLYAPGWRTGWGQAVRDADPR